MKSLPKDGLEFGGKAPDEILNALGTSRHVKVLEMVREIIKDFDQR